MNLPRTTHLTLKTIAENLDQIPTKHFAADIPKLTKEEKLKLKEMASMFETYGKMLRQENAIMESAKSIGELCKLAEKYAINECGDVFQRNVVKKDMAGLTKRVSEYMQLSETCYNTMQEMGAIYDDIQHVLGRYYELKSVANK